MLTLNLLLLTTTLVSSPAVALSPAAQSTLTGYLDSTTVTISQGTLKAAPSAKGFNFGNNAIWKSDNTYAAQLTTETAGSDNSKESIQRLITFSKSGPDSEMTIVTVREDGHHRTFGKCLLTNDSSAPEATVQCFTTGYYGCKMMDNMFFHRARMYKKDEEFQKYDKTLNDITVWANNGILEDKVSKCNAIYQECSANTACDNSRKSSCEKVISALGYLIKTIYLNPQYSSAYDRLAEADSRELATFLKSRSPSAKTTVVPSTIEKIRAAIEERDQFLKTAQPTLSQVAGVFQKLRLAASVVTSCKQAGVSANDTSSFSGTVAKSAGAGSEPPASPATR